ncbi:MAG: hypothetical protein RLP15_12900, partial [Cryomorphaceae bacterium]
MSRLSSIWRAALIVLSLFFFCSLETFAQSPQGINYQAVARDADGNPLADTSLSVTISLSQTASLSVTQYIEVWSVQTNDYGLFTLVIGEGSPTLGTFLDVTWETGTVWLNVQVGSLDMGTSQLMSVPYALYAENSDDGDWGMNDSTVFTNQKVGIGTDQPIADLDMFLTGQSAYAAFSGTGDGNNYAGMLLGAAGQNRRWNILHRQEAATQNGLLFEYFDGSNFYSRFYIDAIGKVGIGNTDPQALLDVSGLANVDSLSINGSYRFPSSDGGIGQVLVTDGSGNLVWSTVSDSLQSFELLNDTTLRITEGGGDIYDLNISALATDQELQAIVNALTNTIDSISAQVAINRDSINILNDSMLAMQADIATNATDIATNVTSIQANADSIDVVATNVATNTTDIATNVTNIQANADSIDVVATNVATNTTDIATNVTNIQANADSIDVVATNVATNTTGIATNVTNIQANADSIDVVATNVATNTTDIATNVTNIQANADSIDVVATNVSIN